MYCVKCKKATDTTNEQFTVSKNGRNMKRVTCIICGTTKTQFIKAQTGGSLLNKFINNLPFEMHLPGHRVPRGSVVRCLTRNPGVLGSSLTISSGFFRGSVLGQDTSEPSLVLVKSRKS